MTGLREYIQALIVTALICGTVSGLVKDTFGKRAIHFISGLLLTITLLKPVLSITDWEIPRLDEIHFDASEHVRNGEALAQTSMEEIIKSETEAYILDKAAGLGIQIEAEVELDTRCIPVSVQICGNVSSYQRKRLEEVLISEMGITKENQIWTG